MDKNAIKKYAVWARRELISRVSQRAALYDITAEGYGDPDATAIRGKILSEEERKQRSALIDQIQEKGYEQVMEEIAYTWFNRFSALRFMEVNGYLPTHIRVFTDDENNFKPQILTEAINMELDGLDMQKVYALKNANDDDSLFKYMIITQCNALSSILPGMFQNIDDYTELLFPDNLLREGSVVEQMISMIPQEDWTDQVQIIGWLYQYYNTEPKDQVFANLKKNIKISKENIPAATQLFTPDWIVRYMVENSLGRLWLEGHPNDDLKANWKYYLDEAEQEPEVQAQLAELRKEYATLKLEDILVIDPCQGSGHILAYMFDVLVQIYEAYGYSAREAASSIVEHNIWGLDIDERASQLAYFLVMMKARQYDRRFFSRGIQPHVYAIQESNNLDPHCIEYFVDGRKDLKSAMDILVKELHDAKEYGSLLNVTQVDFSALYDRLDEIRNEVAPSLYSNQSVETLLPFVQVAQAMAQKFNVVCTNPPYMAITNAAPKLYDFVHKYYPASKADLFAVFIEKCHELLNKNGIIAMITQHAWMFLSSFEKLRGNLLGYTTINMAHLGPRAFEEIGGEVVQTTAFTMSHQLIHKYKGTYARLVEPTNQQGKEELFLSGNSLYYMEQNRFALLPGRPFAYWVSPNFIANFGKSQYIGETRKGMVTADNTRFIRAWSEVNFQKIGFGFSNRETAKASGMKWFPYIKGGEYRKWYGNLDWVVNWENDGYELLNMKNEGYKVGSTNHNLPFIFKPAICWTKISSNFSARIVDKGFLIDDASPFIYIVNEQSRYFCLGLYNTPVSQEYLKLLNPTMNFSPGTISNIPYLKSEEYSELIVPLVQDCIRLSEEDWNAFETAWGFQQHPLIPQQKMGDDNAFINHEGKLDRCSGIDYHVKDCYENWQQECENRFKKVKVNEEKINKAIISLYNLQNELTPEIEEKNITVRKANLQRDIRSLISYIVGCMFGRYSLDYKGIAYAGGDWDALKYITFQPDSDAILPICDDEYFDDDIVGRFIQFIEMIYGKGTLEENLRFIADALGGRGTSREVIRNYFINDFYSDHLKIYQKRPIYWLFDSGKKNGFKCLIYLHRYQPDTIARIRTDYVHEQQSRYRTAIADLEKQIANAGITERVKLTKRINSINAQAEELRVYEEKIHHLADQMITIDLDDGVKVNYAKFQDVLAKLK